MKFENESNYINTDLTIALCYYNFAQHSGMIYFRANQKVHKLDSTVYESIYHAYVTA